MEKCAQCKKTETQKAQWRNSVSRYHDGEIQHYLCPQSSVSSFSIGVLTAKKDGKNSWLSWYKRIKSYFEGKSIPEWYKDEKKFWERIIYY